VLKDNLSACICLALDRMVDAARMLEERVNGKPGDVEGKKKFTLM
jgi:hypothetical protein